MKRITAIVFFLSFLLQSHAQTYSRFQKPLDERLRQTSIDDAVKNGIPLCFIEVNLDYDKAGIPILNLYSQNVTLKVIEQYVIEVQCFDKNNAPVYPDSKGTNVYTGISQFFKPSLSDVYFPDTWVLEGFKNTTRVKVYLTNVRFWDKSTWSPSDKRITMIESREN